MNSKTLQNSGNKKSGMNKSYPQGNDRNNLPGIS